MTTYETISVIIQGAVGAAVVATIIVYYHQLRTMQGQLTASRESSAAQNILAVVNFLQSEDVRAARGVVRQRLRNKSLQDWDSHERQAASCVCANYDCAAVLLREKLVPLGPFVDNWGPSVVDCYKILLPHIEEMQRAENSGPNYWNDFRWLYEQVEANGGRA